MHLDFLTLNDVNIKHKTVLMREDFNVPIENGVVQSDLRIRAALPGIKQVLAADAQVILMSHLGRPQAGHWQAEFSLQPVAECLQELLQTPVAFVKEWDTRKNLPNAKLILLENVRFLEGETENAANLAQKMANLADVFVMDAFGSAHRAHASTVGVVEYAPVAVAGPLLLQEITALQKIMHASKRPLEAVIGGAKISSKLAVLESLITMVDVMLIGGGMANTLLAAQGNAIGRSLCEVELIPDAKQILERAKNNNCQILLPIDVVTQDGTQKSLADIQATDQIFDIGALTVDLYTQQISKAATVLWNGPMGVFEKLQFAAGTNDIALAIAACAGFSVAGGGDTLAAIDQLNLTPKFGYISTGGGAFLEYIEGKPLPTLTALINKSKHDIKKN